MPIFRKLHAFRTFTAAERLILIEALALPLCISLSFRLLGVPRTQALLRRWASGGNKEAPPVDSEHEIRIARRAQRVVKRTTGVDGTCLVRSLTLWALLLRRGLSTELRVGFRKREGVIEGHAWLEYRDAPVNDDRSETQTFIPYEQAVSFDSWRQIKRSKLAVVSLASG